MKMIDLRKLLKYLVLLNTKIINYINNNWMDKFE